MPSFEPVIAVVRALNVLRILNSLGRASLKEIHERSRLHRSTILRMLETLMHEGYVTRNQADGTYAPTGKTLLLSSGFEANSSLAELAKPILQNLRDRIGWPSDIAVLDGDAMFVVATSREFSIVALNYKAGARPPLLHSSLGRAYLAFCTPARREQLIASLAAAKREVDAPLLDDPARLNELLEEIRLKGYATPDEAFDESSGAGLATGFSVPVFNADQVAASLSVVFLRNALSLSDGVKTLLPSLRRAAAEIGDALSKEYR